MYSERLQENIKYFNDCLNNESHEILFGIRPEDITEGEAIVLVKHPSQKIKLQVSIAELLGNEYYAHLQLNGGDLIAKVNADKALSNGDSIEVVFNLDKIKIFDKVTSINIESK